MFNLTEPLSLKVIGLAIGAGLFLSLLLGVARRLRTMMSAPRRLPRTTRLLVWQNEASAVARCLNQWQGAC